MARTKKIFLWLFGILLGTPLLLVLAYPLISIFAVDYKYANFASMHPPSATNYEAEIEGAQPVQACGGTAGKYNFGEKTRRYVSLNSEWQVEQGPMGEQAPDEFTHRVPVPGLMTSAVPAFKNVGVVDPEREAFWYQKTFRAPDEASATALLCIAKAKYGMRAWLNGVPLGDHYGAFTQAEFDISEAIAWGQDNELVVRLGAERSRNPAFIPSGQDNEKTHFIPGIWDDVNLLFTGAQTVVRVKIETDIGTGEIHVLTTVRNNTDEAVVAVLDQGVREWRSGVERGGSQALNAPLGPLETRTFSQTIAVEDYQLWQLDDPFLYVLDTRVSVAGSAIDDRATRFGIRDARWRAGEGKGFYLNGEKTLLRGSNFSLHRFFEDEKAGNLAWNESWVRRLYTTYPREYQWNVFRTSIGRLPNFWYHIADEEGFLIDDEFAYWSLAFPPKKKDMDTSHLEWSIVELEKEFSSWIQENWNHPSIILWSASNETVDLKSTEVIDRVRHLDGTRQWENGGWQKPHAEEDPIEDHPYIFAANFNPIAEMLGLSAKGIEALDKRDGQPIPPTDMMGMTYPSDTQAHIINEYGWLWLNRDGSPTILTEKVYETLLEENNTETSRRETFAYFHAGLTGFWRAKRGYQGVQHFSYLNHSKPGTGYTSDNFIDMPNLVMEPRWHEYHRNVWSPVAVYIDQWADVFRRGASADVPLIVINDFNEPVNGVIELVAASAAGEILKRSELTKIHLKPLDQQVLSLSLRVPTEEQFVLFARFRYGEDLEHKMVDRRKYGFEHPGIVVSDNPALF